MASGIDDVIVADDAVLETVTETRFESPLDLSQAADRLSSRRQLDAIPAET